MSEQERVQPGSALTARQDFLRTLWEGHVRYTFATRNTEDTLNTIAHIYWDQATSVLVQLGLLDARTLPVAGVETARKALDPTL